MKSKREGLEIGTPTSLNAFASGGVPITPWMTGELPSCTAALFPARMHIDKDQQ